MQEVKYLSGLHRIFRILFYQTLQDKTTVLKSSKLILCKRTQLKKRLLTSP